jgi:hypothetical protein
VNDDTISRGIDPFDGRSFENTRALASGRMEQSHARAIRIQLCAAMSSNRALTCDPRVGEQRGLVEPRRRKAGRTPSLVLLEEVIAALPFGEIHGVAFREITINAQLAQRRNDVTNTHPTEFPESLGA